MQSRINLKLRVKLEESKRKCPGSPPNSYPPCTSHDYFITLTRIPLSQDTSISKWSVVVQVTVILRPDKRPADLKSHMMSTNPQLFVFCIPIWWCPESTFHESPVQDQTSTRQQHVGARLSIKRRRAQQGRQRRGAQQRWQRSNCVSICLTSQIESKSSKWMWPWVKIPVIPQ